MPNLKWSEPETNNPITYANEFGEVILEPVTDFMPISEITRDKLPIINDMLISMDQAEQVALITENRRAYINICFPLLPVDKAAFAIKYSSANRAAVCSVNIKNFKTRGNISAQAQIEELAPKQYGPMAVY
jgi:hypothetical protein